jgi:hypothetical protein
MIKEGHMPSKSQVKRLNEQLTKNAMKNCDFMERMGLECQCDKHKEDRSKISHNAIKSGLVKKT